MKNRTICKTLAVAVIILFLGLAIQPSVAVQSETEIDIEPKDYLFQTIIDIANNPEIKNLLEKYKPDLFKVDIDRSIYRKLLLRNPRLFFNTLFTKPSMSVDYLDKCYNNGIEITDILGEDKVLETMENVEVTDTEYLNELNSIISMDKELSSRIDTLKEINKEYPSGFFWNFPIICGILLVSFLPMGIILEILKIIESGKNPIFGMINYLFAWLLFIPIAILENILVYFYVIPALILDCWYIEGL